MMFPAEHAAAAVAVAWGGSGATVDAAFRAAVPVATVGAPGCGRFDVPDDDTVDSWSWMSIIWSPNRMVRFKGALPDRKSFTCKKKPYKTPLVHKNLNMEKIRKTLLKKTSNNTGKKQLCPNRRLGDINPFVIQKRLE